jgi:hypothetical protein
MVYSEGHYPLGIPQVIRSTPSGVAPGLVAVEWQPVVLERIVPIRGDAEP